MSSPTPTQSSAKSPPVPPRPSSSLNIFAPKPYRSSNDISNNHESVRLFVFLSLSLSLSRCVPNSGNEIFTKRTTHFDGNNLSFTKRIHFTSRKLLSTHGCYLDYEISHTDRKISKNAHGKISQYRGSHCARKH